MKPTQQQKQWLKDYLYQVMEYKETYEEVYDHILLAIENAPEQEFFESVVANIMEKDFGGNNGLLQLEEQCRETAEENTKAQYRTNFKQWFASPLVAVTLLLFAIQFAVLHIKAAFLWSLLFLVILFFVPVLIYACRGLGLGYKYADTKASIKDEISKKLTFKSYQMMWKWYFISTIYGFIAEYVFNIHPAGPVKTHPINAVGFHILASIIAVIIVLMIVHILSIIKLYHSEFKTSILAN